MKKSRLKFFLIFTLLILLLVGCSGNQEGSSPVQSGDQSSTVTISEENQTIGVTDDTIKVGAWGPLTGDNAQYRVVQYAADALFKYVNEQGGIHGRKIEYKIYDDQYQPSKTVGVAKKLVEEDEVFALVASMGTGNVQAVLPYLQEHGVPIISPSTSHPSMTEPPIPLLYPTQLSNSIEGELNAWFVVKELGAKKPAIMHLNNETGEGNLKPVNKILDKYGIEPSATVPVNLNDTDYTPYVLKLKQANPDVVMLFTYPAQTKKIFEAANAIGFKPTWFVNYWSNDPAMFDLLGDLWDGVYSNNWVRGLDSDSSEVALFKEQFKKYYPNEEIGIFSLQGWAMTKTFIEALEIAGPELTRDKLIEAMESIKDFDNGISGPISFGPDDHLGAESVMFVQMKDGQTVPITEFIDLNDLYEEEGWER